jgi:hypothetical protein
MLVRGCVQRGIVHARPDESLFVRQNAQISSRRATFVNVGAGVFPSSRLILAVPKSARCSSCQQHV